MRRLSVALVVSWVLGMSAGVVAAQPSPLAQPDAGVRVDVPAAAVAMTFPVGWSVSVDFRPADPPAGQPVPGGERWVVLTAADGSGANGCRLFRFETSGLTLEGFADALLAGQSATLALLRVAAGDAIRVDLDVGEAETARQYLFSSGDASFQLACLGAGQGIVDDWQALAEAFEILPAGE